MDRDPISPVDRDPVSPGDRDPILLRDRDPISPGNREPILAAWGRCRIERDLAVPTWGGWKMGDPAVPARGHWRWWGGK